MSGDSFQGAVDFLYSFADFSVERSYRYSAEVFELQRVKDLLHSIGDPQENFKAFHVAGTKGKGSVAAMTASILHEAGYRTGLYTSPHLVRLNERFQIDGAAISDNEFVAVIEHLKPHIDSFPGLTVFEILTSMAFLFFAQQGADCAVIEVGLGGRLDATNVLAPLVSVITTLSYDHMHLLGDSLSDIAREKAGIIKPGIPVVLSPQQIEAVIDTGYNGYLTLPGRLVTALQLPFAGHRRGTLADGSVTRLDVYLASVVWHRQQKDVLISQAAGAPLIGMSVREGNRLTMDVFDGGTVTIEALP